MGTHPIFESDFDCLTDMRNLIVYRMVNGNPVRLLSGTTKLRGGHGNYHEGDQPKPKEFLEAAAFLTEAQRPSVIRLTEEDMTPEFKAEKAKKYNMLPEDYYPLSIQQAGNSGGDYPVMVEESYFCRPANYEWDHMLHRMNWGRPIGKYELTRQGQAGVVFDGHYHPYGYWQYWQHFKLYFLTWFAVMLGIPLVANYWEAYAPVRVSDDHWTHHKACAVKSGKLFYERWFSHSELEFKDILLKMQQAKLGFPGRSDADSLPKMHSGSANLYLANTGDEGRHRHGPKGASYVYTEHQDTYMVPAGSMAFKMGHMLNSGSFGQLIPGGPYSANKWREDGYRMASDASSHLHSHGHADSEEVMTGPTPAYP